MYVTALIDEEKCNGCRLCIQTCPEPNAIAFVAGKKKAVVVFEKCKGCGLCIVKCPRQCIVLTDAALAGAR